MKYAICTKCKRELPATLEYFAEAPKKKNGLTSHCRECRNRRKRNLYKERKENNQYQEYYQANKLKYKATTLRQRGYENITENELNIIIDNFKNDKGILICPYCGREILDLDMIHFDHFIPYSVDKLKERNLSNLVPVCKYCNRSKWDEPFRDWYRQQFFYDSIKEQEIIDYVNKGQLVPFYLHLN